MTLINTVFWLLLHFGTAYAITSLPAPLRSTLFHWNRPFFRVSSLEMRFYRAIRLPRWKDRLPQFNADFDKRHLRSTLSAAYLQEFLQVTCQAEVIHYAIALLGYLSLLFCLLCDDPAANFPLFFAIASVLAAGNLPFSAIQRYNRRRLVHLLERITRSPDQRS